MTRRLVLGTAGHIDHGKTALVAALTGTDTDRLPEEKRRGITIDIGFARLALEEGLEMAVVDVPGHEAFIRNMLAGATGVDVVLLVVAADEGMMPQTREHLAIMELLGVRSGVVALTKTDLVEEEWLALVEDDLRAALAPTLFAEAAVVPVSARTGAGLDALRRALAAAADAARARGSEDLLRLPIDRVFTARGAGTVVTGTVWSGRVAPDDTVRLLPAGRALRVRGVQVHGADVAEAAAGQRAALALVGIERDELRRGDTLVREEGWEPATALTVRLRMVESSGWELRPRQRVRFHLGTAEVMGRVQLLEAAALVPGEEGWARLRLEAPVVARAGDRFVIRSYSPVTTIGGGVVVEPGPRRGRVSAEAAALLADVLGPPVDAVRARVRLAGWAGVRLARLPLLTPHPPGAVADAVAALDGRGLRRIGELALDAALADEAREGLLRRTAEHHARFPLRPGIEREELRRALPGAVPPAVVEWALSALLAEGRLEPRGSAVAAAGFHPVLTAEQAAARERLLAAYEDAALAPPTLAELPPELRRRDDLWPLLKLLEGEGALVPIAQEAYMARSALDAAIASARARLAGRGALSPTDFKDVFTVSRKYLIPLLEFLDRSGVTVRRGNERYLAE